MATELKKQFKVLQDELFFFYLLIFGGSLFGIILLQIIMRTEGGTADYFPLGTFMGMIVFFAYGFIVAVVGFRQYFNMEISMGCTRKNFFLSYFIISVLSNLAGVLLVLGICKVESMMYKALYPDIAMGRARDFLFFISRFGVPAAFALAMVGIFCSAMLLRFGRKAYWVFWAVWMLGFVGGPQIHEAAVDSPTSPLGILGRALLRVIGAVPGRAWAVIAALLCAVCLLVSYLVVRRQQVS